ncbi:hypothetical protein ACGFU4_36075 [Streptomyces sp. NPDC048511]|uniref:hypothetical protein n=1 Tax=Streptomyces sp. NPDC048511 TaxID=3365562 RepID=UPI00371B5A26
MESTTPQPTTGRTEDLCICGHYKVHHITNPLTCQGCQSAVVEIVHHYTPALGIIRH